MKFLQVWFHFVYGFSTFTMLSDHVFFQDCWNTLSVVVEMRTSILVCLLTPGAFLEEKQYYQVPEKSRNNHFGNCLLIGHSCMSYSTMEIHHCVVHACAAVCYLRYVILFIWKCSSKAYFYRIRQYWTSQVVWTKCVWLVNGYFPNALVCVCKNKEAQEMCFVIQYIPFFPSSLPCTCISTSDGSCWIRPRSLKD